jgi:hypothetical protein
LRVEPHNTSAMMSRYATEEGGEHRMQKNMQSALIMFIFAK